MTILTNSEMQHYSLFEVSFSFAQPTQYLNCTNLNWEDSYQHLNIEQGRLEMKKTGTSLSTLPDVGVGEHFEEREYKNS